MNDYAPRIENAFLLNLCEASCTVQEVEGEIPDFIRGTYYLNGPARFSRAGLRYRHWLDGDGMVAALRFENGGVYFTNRFVRSHRFVAEEEAGHAIFRAFGTAFDGDQLVRGIALASPVNVSVYPYSGTLLAFGEQGLPWELDPVTLETRGEYNFDGCLNEISPFSAHPKFDPVTGDLFNFGISFSATRPNLNLYRFDARANLLYRRRIPLDYPCSIHDFILSPKYAVFYLSPYILNMEAVTRNAQTLMDSLSWEPERGSQLRLALRETGEAIASIPIGSRYCLHLINSFEIDNRLMIDVVEYERPIYDQYQEVPNLFTDVPAGRPVRLIVDQNRWELIERKQIDYWLAPDFPSIDPEKATQPYRDFWMLGISATGQHGRKFFDQLVHADWDEPAVQDIYQAPPMHYFGAEPVFIRNPGCRAAGAVICHIFDAEDSTSAFAIFDSSNVSKGPIGQVKLRIPIPLGFHTSFQPDRIGN